MREGTKIIEVRGLSKAFDDKVVLNEINATFKPGNINCIIGRSGAGKTVLLKSLIGLIQPTSGEILFAGHNMMLLSKEELKRLRQALLERVGLEGAQSKFPAEISGGMMKRVAIARAVALNPHYLFCDEPNSGLDPTTSASIDKLLKELTEEFQITTVVNTHDMNSIKTIANHILYLDKGEVAWQGSREELSGDIPLSLKNFLYL